MIVAANRPIQETDNRKRLNSVLPTTVARRVDCRVKVWEGSMQAWEDDEASVTGRIIDLETDEIVGLLYQWRDGATQPLWFDGVRENVRYTNLVGRCAVSE